MLDAWPDLPLLRRELHLAPEEHLALVRALAQAWAWRATDGAKPANYLHRHHRKAESRAAAYQAEAAALRASLVQLTHRLPPVFDDRRVLSDDCRAFDPQRAKAYQAELLAEVLRIEREALAVLLGDARRD